MAASGGKVVVRPPQKVLKSRTTNGQSSHCTAVQTGGKCSAPINQQDKPQTKLADRYQLFAVTDRSTNFALASLPELRAELTG